jgi:hypothetical protein
VRVVAASTAPLKCSSEIEINIIFLTFQLIEVYAIGKLFFYNKHQVQYCLSGCDYVIDINYVIDIETKRKKALILSPETIKKLSLYRAVFSTFFEKR